MRQKTEERLPLCHLFPDHQMARELEKISEILDHNPRISALVLQDLCDTSNPQKGASGLSAEFVLRATLVKQLHGFSYEQLAFHLLDSQSFRSFVRHPLGWMPNKSTLQRNISKISEASWKEINTVLVGWAAQKGLEKGQRIRLDSTAVESDIHHPTDSALLDDAVRTVSRLLGQLKERQDGLEAEGQASTVVVFTNHSRRAKRRAFQIANGRGAKRQRAYRDLLKVARKTYGYGLTALQADLPAADLLTVALLVSLEHYLKLMARVIDQTERRVLRGETVPAAEKVFSIFEEHTDIIKKGQREPTYGHKIFLTGGRSSLILNCEVLAGNPADVGQLQPLLGAHREVYGRYPRQMAADRGFYSQANLTWAKGEGIQDAAFDRKGSLPISEMVRSSWLYKQLRRFRAGIEGCISWLKRVFGLDRCTWKGWEHFQQYVQASVVSYNLLVLARLLP